MSIAIDLKGKTAVVCGGGRGLGRAIAEKLGEAGANVFIGNRNEEEGKETVQAIQNRGVKSGYHKLDVAVEAEVVDFFAAALEFANGKIDIVVHNAGIIETRSLLEIQGEDAKRVYEINVIGLGNVLKAALNEMISKQHGKIVTIPSIAGVKALGMLEHYSASKFATVALTKNAALQAAPYHINVNAVAPGIIRTKMWEEILDSMTEGSTKNEERNSTFDESVKNLIPFGNAQTEEDIANAVLFLVSDLAKEITGQVLAVDGGTTI